MAKRTIRPTQHTVPDFEAVFAGQPCREGANLCDLNGERCIAACDAHVAAGGSLLDKHVWEV